MSELDMRGVTPAVIDASFEVNEGEIFVVMGLSGSGKSTLIRMLNGLLEATSGKVYVDDEDITVMSGPKIREMRSRRMSMVFQHFALFPHRTVLQNAAYGLQVQGIDKAQRTEKALEALTMVGLEGWESHLPEQLSGGMRQRVGLARALAADTHVLLMDEAFSALDPLIRREMQDQLIALQKQLGKTIVFITHDLNEAMRLGDRIAMMRQGRIVQIGTAQEILTAPANDYVAQFVQDVDRTRVLTAASVMTKAVTVDATSKPDEALSTMGKHQCRAVYVLDGDNRVTGVLGDTEAANAASKGIGLAQAMTRDFASVGPETPVNELFTASAESALPLAVVDGDRRLLGVIPRSSLLAALGEVEETSDGTPGGDH